MKTHPYCSKSCAIMSQKSLVSSVNGAIRSLGDCDFCHARPKNVVGDRIHDFCSKTCARSAEQKSARLGVSTRKATCQAPGCQAPVYVDKGGQHSNYCSISHKILKETLCLLCLEEPTILKSNFCSWRCKNHAEERGPMLLEVPLGHKTFQSIADQFK
ncbi:uncharacterized protein LACBIDRAFT_316767 [Laccaria bicolor S238N-H82]|uniref:Predicted protein n=1 Tax=Laccaria bicolor (strain S238N-H82 / ATCC MYA-4686) TaxID=486041 RepID=B0E1K8_LACBS|nr:uncharacterized protein LACBIDRAFT_316767 [Laccaria bicolor S238N-H82]EDQ99281.1 predicted protein [Laccaria bicolor S238N-H82]|eukprot:XP_001890091.1 predicted protein [Laccaria bicolor S238N-H82]